MPGRTSRFPSHAWLPRLSCNQQRLERLSLMRWWWWHKNESESPTTRVEFESSSWLNVDGNFTDLLAELVNAHITRNNSTHVPRGAGKATASKRRVALGPQEQHANGGEEAAKNKNKKPRTTLPLHVHRSRTLRPKTNHPCEMATNSYDVCFVSHSYAKLQANTHPSCDRFFFFSAADASLDYLLCRKRDRLNV